MNEIAETASDTPLPTIQPTTRFAEIRDGGEFAVDRAGGVPAAVQGIAGFLCGVFVFETCVDVADQMIIIIITNHDLLNLSKLTHLTPKVFIKSIKVILQLRSIHLVLGIVGGVLVEVGQQDGLAVGGLDVFSRAAVAVAAGTDFVVEGAVYFVGFGAEDGGEVVRHFEEGCAGRGEVALLVWRL